MRNVLLAGVASALLLSACGGGTPAAPAAVVETPKAVLGTFGVDLSAMDTSVNPGEDFYKYVNGKWLATATMPADKASYGAFDKLRDKSDEQVHTLLDDLQKTPPTDPTAKKVADFYASWMDEATIETRGFAPLKPDLDKIAAVKNAAELTKLMGEPGFAAPFGYGVSPDPADTTKYVIFVGQGGLGLGYNYWTGKEDKSVAIRAAYKDFITTTFKLIGDPTPEKSAQTVYDLEKKIVDISWDPVKQRDIKLTYNPMDMAGLKKLAPTVDWPAFFAAGGVEGLQHVVVGETTEISAAAKLIQSQPLDAWKKYMVFNLARASANTSCRP